jgi:hypothetical protein
MIQDKVTKLNSDVGRNVWDEGGGGLKPAEQPKKKMNFGQWWAKSRPTKTVVFWSWISFIILTMIVGFNWGGWVTGDTAQKMAETTAGNAVMQRLTPMCVVQFNQDPLKAQKLTELKAKSSWQQRDYVATQGWATMPGEAKPDNQVADECAKLLVQSK